MIRRHVLRSDVYKDSVRLLEAARAMREHEGVSWATAIMATAANTASLTTRGFLIEVSRSTANDLILAVCAHSEAAADEALEKATALLFSASDQQDCVNSELPTDILSARAARPTANLAVISVPGEYATLEAEKALSAGLHVFLFSDNVPVADEIALKRRAAEVGRLMMGPGAGTALLAGAGLGFANRLSQGPVGIVAASGTGAQEVATLLDRCGVGISHIIGVGGRDMSTEVGGLGTEAALRALDADDGTRAILLVSKPGAREVAQRLLQIPGKPMVAALIGSERPVAPHRQGVTICDTLEAGAVEMLRILGKARPDAEASFLDALVAAVAKLTATRTRLVGLFSGGTLCYEAMIVASRLLGPIHSNIPIDTRWSLKEAGLGSHVCIDLGEEEYTKGSPHPVIDAAARLDLLERQASDPTVAVILLDVILGDGAHPDPAGVLAPAADRVVRSGAAIVVHLVGTARDPQDLLTQRQRFQDVGCIVAASAAQAALAGAAIVLRDPTVLLPQMRLPSDLVSQQTGATLLHSL